MNEEPAPHLRVLTNPSKRRVSDCDQMDGQGPRKRRRSHSDAMDDVGYVGPNAAAKQGLGRTIALALQGVGFSAAEPLAMDYFISLVESYMDSFFNDVKSLSTTARRDVPNPVDFERALRRFNLPVSSLKPHTRRTIDRRLLNPEFFQVDTTEKHFLRPLPTLGAELSGDAEKKARDHVPGRFPGFPSKHTFMSTPTDASQAQLEASKTREAAAHAAKQGEDALRGLLRAAKIPQQKEIRKQVQRHQFGRHRHRLWEDLMAKKMNEEGAGINRDDEEVFQKAVANTSMIVNWAAETLRTQVTQGARRIPKKSGSHDEPRDR